VSGDNRFRCLWPVDADDTDLPSEARSAIHARQSGNEERVQV
jgi:hypothetical protein